MASEDDILKEAIADTENEIFSEAVGKDLPSTEGGPGDRSVEEMGEGLEGQHEPEETTLEADDATGKDGDKDGEKADPDADAGDGKAPVKDPKTGQFIKAKTEGDDKTDKGENPDADLLEADGKPKQRVPVSDLIQERKGRRAAEARIKELEGKPPTLPQGEIERLVNARIAEVLGQQKVAPKSEAETVAPDEIDIFTNPEAWKAQTAAGIEKALTQKYVAADLARTADAHGEKFTTAYKAITDRAQTDPAVRVEIQKIWNSATPGADLMKWHAKQEVQRIIGDDPDAYTKRIETEAREKLANDPEFRKQLLKALQDDARAGEGEGTPRHIARMPKSLNGASGGQSQGGGGAVMDGSDKGVFDSAFQQ